MAAFIGIKGSIALGTAAPSDLISGGAHALLANRWEADEQTERHDVTPFSSTTRHRVSIPGLHKLTGMASGFLDDTTPHDATWLTAATNGETFTMTATTGRTYSFPGGLSNFRIQNSNDAPATWSASFESTGAITTA
jgi:hypothetical protein